MGGENLLCSQRQNIRAQRQLLFIARADNILIFFFLKLTSFPLENAIYLQWSILVKLGKIVKWFNIEMDTSFRISCLLYTEKWKTFLLLWCLHFVPTMYIIGMIIYCILEYFYIQSSFFTFQLYFYSRSLTSCSLLFVWGFFFHLKLLQPVTLSHLLSPKCLNKFSFLAHCSWRQEMMAKSWGFSKNA